MTLSKAASPAAVGTGPKTALFEGTPPATTGLPPVAAVAVAPPAAPGTPPAVVASPPPNPNAQRDAFWNLAAKRYVPPATGIEPAEPGTAVTPSSAVSTIPSASQPAIAAAPAHDLNPADIPFATWAPGKRGVVKSPYDPTGRLIDVRDFNAGQLSQCPYTGKIFRVPPLK